MPACPKCQSTDVHRSRAKSKWEHWRRDHTAKCPLRCRVCHWRGWGVDPGPVFSSEEIERASRAVAPDPPALPDALLAPTGFFAAPIDPEPVDLTAVDYTSAPEPTNPA
jgi:hypothetical protein